MLNSNFLTGMFFSKFSLRVSNESLTLAVNIILNKKGIDKEKLYGLEGIVNVTDIES